MIFELLLNNFLRKDDFDLGGFKIIKFFLGVCVRVFVCFLFVFLLICDLVIFLSNVDLCFLLLDWRFCLFFVFVILFFCLSLCLLFILKFWFIGIFCVRIEDSGFFGNMVVK